MSDVIKSASLGANTKFMELRFRLNKERKENKHRHISSLIGTIFGDDDRTGSEVRVQETVASDAGDQMDADAKVKVMQEK